jgi:hypothetical protein
VPPELDGAGRDHIQRERQHADRAAGPRRVDPSVQVGQRSEPGSTDRPGS